MNIIPVQVLIPGINTIPGPSELYILQHKYYNIIQHNRYEKTKKKRRRDFFLVGIIVIK